MSPASKGKHGESGGSSDLHEPFRHPVLTGLNAGQDDQRYYTGALFSKRNIVIKYPVLFSSSPVLSRFSYYPSCSDFSNQIVIIAESI